MAQVTDFNFTKWALPQMFDGINTVLKENDTYIRFAILNLFRRQFPDYHVTCTGTESFDLFGFEQAGKATLTREYDIDRVAMWYTVRGYTPASRRFERNHGSLTELPFYTRYTLKYKDDCFPVFHVSWKEGWCNVEFWYILSPMRTAGTEGHHPATDALLLDVALWSKELHEEIYVFDDSYWAKSKALWESVKGSSWDDVIMDPKMKQSLIDDVQGFFNSQELYKKFRVPWKRGIILHGVPGNGKTCSIKALMNHLGELEDPIPSLYVKTLDNKNDMPQWSVRDIFKKARKMSPCLLVFEDLDSLIGEKVRSYFLNEVDGLDSNDGILMIGSTNHLDRLDPAISKRPSRFDRKYHFRIPDLAQRELYVEYWRNKLDGTDTQFPQELCPLIAQLTENFSFAYLKELFVISLLVVARGGKGDEEVSDWEEVSESQQTPAESETADMCENDDEEKAKDEAEVSCEHCKHTKAEGKDDKNEKTTSEKSSKKKTEVPMIEVPETLKDNVVLKVFQQQVRMLLNEMDNTEDDKDKKSAKGSKNSDYAMQLQLLRRQNRARLAACADC